MEEDLNEITVDSSKRGSAQGSSQDYASAEGESEPQVRMSETPGRLLLARAGNTKCSIDHL